MVRLETTARDDRARAALLRVGEQELELPDLVARLGAEVWVKRDDSGVVMRA
jgi:1-aminocyclopropane-1-carboxylate deaminase/D-cysteine desulfhydrase-like pyridoxal-dependent ACC family enzyme